MDAAGRSAGSRHDDDHDERESPFAFLRGSADVMAADVATTPDTGLHVQLCGDAHLANFGVFASPERRLMFDLNDFDETYRGPWEWDVKRLAASFVVASRQNGYREATARAMARVVAAEYRTWMSRYARMQALEVVLLGLIAGDGDRVLRSPAAAVIAAVRSGRLSAESGV